VRVLLTGGTGLLGRAVLQRVATEHEVVALHRHGTPAPASPPGVQWTEGDLTSQELPVDAPVDAIVHLAASRRHRDFPLAAGEVHEVSAGATVRLLEHGRRWGARRLVLGSSGAVYAPGAVPLKEQDPPQPPSFYGECKLAAERLAARFAPDISTIALRFFFVYGRDQHDSMFLPALARRIRAGLPVTIAEPDGMRTNPVHVSDAAAAVVAALEGSAEGPCNVAGPETMAIRGLAEVIGRAVGHEPVFEASPSGEGVGGDLIGDLARMRAVLHDPAVKVSDGIREALQRA
jgi:nucleoside-diphosphate-sugar epimerase